MKISTKINLGLLSIALVFGSVSALLQINRKIADVEVSSKAVSNYIAHQLASEFSAFDNAQWKNDETLPDILSNAFINGRVASIKVKDSSGALVIEKKNTTRQKKHFLSYLIALPSTQSSVKEKLSSNTVTVESSPYLDYITLNYQLMLTLASCILIYLFATFFILYLNGKNQAPLSIVTKKLNELQSNNFTPLSIDSSLTEFNYLVSATNNLAISLENKFQELTRQAEQFKSIASKDVLTKLANRNAFERHMKALLGGISNPKEYSLTLVRLAQLNTINHKLGMLAGDNYVCGVADILKKASQEQFQGAFVFRISGGDFAIISDVQSKRVQEETLSLLNKSFSNLNPLRDGSKAAWMGITRFSNGMSMQEIMESADSALMAATKRPQGWQFSSDIAQVHSNAQWRDRLNYVVAQQYADILIQPVMNLERNTPSYYETFARFKDKQTNDIIPMSQLIPASERLDLIPEVDKLVTSIVFKKLKVTLHQVAINLSNASIASSEFRGWLIKQLSEHESLCHRIVFEVQDAALIHYNEEAVALCKRITQLGCRITVEHFGDNFASLSGLRAIQPAYVKLSGRLTESIHTNKDNQLFVSSLLNIARSLNIKVIAEKVEHEAESVALNNLDIIHQQGYYFSKPALWTVY